MIDLEFAHLPDTLIVEGREVPIHTSFRVWLRFGRLAEERGIASAAVLKEPCEGDWVTPALEFYRSENATPRSQSNARVLDLTLDGDYIAGSFQAAYGIDLTSEDMHWHRFLALLRSLPDDSKLMTIVGYRGWRKSSASHDSIMRKMRDDWALPPKDETSWDLSEGASAFLDANEARAREKLQGR